MGWRGTAGLGPADGRAPGRPEQLTVVTEDGREVVATLDDGWFLAWWPSEAEPIRIDLPTVGGELVDSLDLGDQYAHEPSCKVYFLDRLCLWR